MTHTPPICLNCKHFNQDTPGATCQAFPNGIPAEIYEGDNKHKKPLKGQKNDLVFTPR